VLPRVVIIGGGFGGLYAARSTRVLRWRRSSQRMGAVMSVGASVAVATWYSSG
jgi:cation diffusion facilitator CzcD-associated flavoprotein CzcO